MPTVQTAQLQLDQVSLIAPLSGYSLLRDISFQVFRGDRMAIVGASGSGKTTLLRLLNRLSEPTKGQIYLEGEEIRQIPVIQLRQQVTLVSQESKLLGMTVQEALAYPLGLRGIKSSKLIQQRLQEAMEWLHIPSDWLDRTEAQLSVGQRQLVAIARALITYPRVLLLDEPTSALDLGRSSHLINLFNELTQTRQMTILMVNHQLELAKQFCTHVVWLDHGQLLQNLPTGDLDWEQLRADLIATEAREAAEWME